VFEEKHMFEPIDTSKDFVLEDYFKNPENYKSQYERYIPYLDVIVNCIFWHNKCPKLVTRKFLTENPKIKLKVIGDITCDVDGAIEFVTHVTTPDKPALTFYPETGEVKEGYEGEGPSVIAIDNLPCELPVDSSTGFGDALFPFINAIVNTDQSKSFSDLDLPPEIKNAVITFHGELTPNFTYLKKSLES